MAAHFSDSALDDLHDIWSYIALFSADRADAFVALVRRKADEQCDWPDSGKPEDDLAPGLRSFPVRKYLVFYRVVGRRIKVARIIHGARDIPRVFGQSEPEA